jgi:hypothetical protein
MTRVFLSAIAGFLFGMLASSGCMLCKSDRVFEWEPAIGGGCIFGALFLILAFISTDEGKSDGNREER